MFLTFSRKEVLAILKHMAEQDGDDQSSQVTIKIGFDSGIGKSTAIVLKGDEQKDITDYSTW